MAERQARPASSAREPKRCSAAGLASRTTVSANGQEIVSSGGLASLLVVSSGGSATVAAGGKVSGLTLAAGATLIDGGQVLLATRTLAGALSGAGQIVEIAANGVLTLSGDGAAFGGKAVISAGGSNWPCPARSAAARWASSGAPSSRRRLQIDAAAAPAPGATFANTLSNFNADNKAIDLRGLAFHAGANATLSGGVLTLGRRRPDLPVQARGPDRQELHRRRRRPWRHADHRPRRRRLHPGRRHPRRPRPGPAIAGQRLRRAALPVPRRLRPRLTAGRPSPSREKSLPRTRSGWRATKGG